MTETETVAVGDGMWGGIHSRAGRRRCYRLIPTDELVASQRGRLDDLRKRARWTGVAPLVENEEGDVVERDGRYYDVVTYELEVDATLAALVAGPRPEQRLAAVAAALRALPGWWGRVEGMIPAGADIVFALGRPHLLELPAWGVPSIGTLLRSPERIPYLAPEIVRGAAGPDRAADVYALTVTALRCLVEAPDAEPERLLGWAAAGRPEDGPSRLPPWMRQVGAVTGTIDYLRGVLAAGHTERLGTDPAAIADRLDECRESMDPLVAVRRLRAGGNPERALHLAHTILLTDPSYELLVLAAELSYQDLHAPQPLEAWDLLERAVRLQQGRREAYVTQFALVSRFRRDLAGRLSDAVDPSFAERMDATVRTAFAHLPADGTDGQGARAHDLAVYLLDRGHAEEANRTAYAWLTGSGRLEWWRFDLMLDYAASFMLLDRLAEAESVTETIRQGLQKVRANQSMRSAEIGEYGRRLNALRHDLRTMRDR
ncbi:hypothetical protein [Actinoplanes sp. NPDC051851]|uniref:hypothetical protein n=1 Tax=Actinoplanes sp. NPDC051851 TaxID=3154753 RepID=UPI00343B5927